MAKLIKLNADDIGGILADFNKSLSSMRLSDGKINFTKVLPVVERKANVYFTSIAWAKMQKLVSHFNKEVAWHGVAFRGDDENKDDYYVTDILVYPQTVTASTVEMDENKYAQWVTEGDLKDERFYNLRMQGHSHVNMGVSPSGTDLDHQREILSQLSPNSFYIFLIINKKGEKNLKIYDMQKNILFENGDCTLTVLEAPQIEGAVFSGITEEEAAAAMAYVSELRIESQLPAFIKEAESLVREYKPALPMVSAVSGYRDCGKGKKKKKESVVASDITEDDFEDDEYISGYYGYDPYRWWR